jgi:hypothetical protein
VEGFVISRRVSLEGYGSESKQCRLSLHQKERAMTLTIQETVTGGEQISDSTEPLAARVQFIAH